MIHHLSPSEVPKYSISFIRKDLVLFQCGQKKLSERSPDMKCQFDVIMSSTLQAKSLGGFPFRIIPLNSHYTSMQLVLPGVDQGSFSYICTASVGLVHMRNGDFLFTNIIMIIHDFHVLSPSPLLMKIIILLFSQIAIHQKLPATLTELDLDNIPQVGCDNCFTISWTSILCADLCMCDFFISWIKVMTLFSSYIEFSLATFLPWFPNIPVPYIIMKFTWSPHTWSQYCC